MLESLHAESAARHAPKMMAVAVIDFTFSSIGPLLGVMAAKY